MAIPAWAWVAGIIAVSIVVRIALARRMVAPWIMVDEIVYSELAKSFAAHGHFLIRGVTSRGYGIVYPALIAPAWRLFGPIPDAYVAAKVINSVLMSLAAIPAYLLARRVLSQTLAVVAAGLAVLIPSMLYTGMLMTENAFYPVFLVVALVFVATLERPTPLRQVGLLVLCGLAFETRAQAVALFPAIASAPILLALVERRGLRRGLRPFATLYGILAAGVVVALVGTVARGRSPATLLGAYHAATSSTYTVSGILHFVVYHVAELDLYLGIFPFAALTALWLAPRRSSRAVRTFAVASFAISFWLLAEVAAFASQAGVDRIEERNMFYLAPFALIALVGLASDDVVAKGRRTLLIAAGVAGVLPVFIPFARFITTSAVSDTFALMPWWWAQDNLISLAEVRWAALGVSLLAGVVFVFLPRRYVLVLPALVAAYFVATAFVVDNGRHGIHKASVGSLWAGTHFAQPDWIDRAVGRGASVAVLWDGKPDPYPVWENEFFNRSVRTVYDLGDATRPDPLPETPANRTSTGVVMSDGRAIHARYVLVDSFVELEGRVLKADPVGVDLYRVNGPIVILTSVKGVYPNDTWAGRTVTYQRVDCAGGRLSVDLETDPAIFTRAQTVVAIEAGRVVGRTSIQPQAQATLTVPLTPVNRLCAVRFQLGYTLVPSAIHAGANDDRHLGAHFLAFRFHR